MSTDQYKPLKRGTILLSGGSVSDKIKEKVAVTLLQPHLINSRYTIL